MGIDIVRERVTLVGIAAIVMLAGGCAATSPVRAPAIDERPLQVEDVADEYLIQVGDLLYVAFYGNEELNQEIIVRPDGKISLPLIDEVAAAGRTPAGLDAEISEAYEGELARPEVTIIVREFGGQRIYVGGEVGEPGVLTTIGPLTLVQAVQEAGGLLPTARRSQVVLIRRGEDGTPIGRSVDIRGVLSGGDPAADVMLSSYDIVYVPRTHIANVNLFVDQYIRKILPVTPGFGFVVGGDDE